MMKAVSTTEISVYFYEATRRSISEGCNLQVDSWSACQEFPRFYIITYTILLLYRAMAQAVNNHPLKAEARLKPRSVHVGFVVDKVKWYWDRFFFELFGFTLSISFHRALDAHICYYIR
jgi:hypothetical protein